MTRPLPALAALTLTALLLAGCTSAFLADEVPGAGTEPSVTATPDPEATTPAPEPGPDLDCGDVLLNRPGNYVLGECGTVTIEGTGIDLAFTSVERLVIRGDRADILGGAVRALEIQGQGSDLELASVGELRIRGEGNSVIVEGTIDSVVVDGNENVVTAGEGITAQIDNGLLNEIG